MKSRSERQRLTNVLLLIVVIFIIGLVLKLVQPVITALLISVLLAYLMDTFIVFMRRFKVPLALAYALTIVIFVGIFLGVGYLIVRNMREFQVDFPTYEYKVLNMIQGVQRQAQDFLSAEIPFDPIAELKKLPLGVIALRTVRSVFGVTFDFAIIFFFAVLIVLGKHQYIRKILTAFPRSGRSRVPHTLSHIDKSLRRYLAVKSFVSAVAATLETLILLLFHVKFAVIFGFLTFVLNFIPTVGAIIATLLPTLFALAQLSEPLTVLWLLICIITVHMVVGNLLDPTLMGETLNLSLLVVFISLFFWGWLWGPVGILLAVPMTVSIKIILQNIPATAPFAAFLEKAHAHRPFFVPRPPQEKPAGRQRKEAIVDKRVSQSL